LTSDDKAAYDGLFVAKKKAEEWKIKGALDRIESLITNSNSDSELTKSLELMTNLLNNL